MVFRVIAIISLALQQIINLDFLFINRQEGIECSSCNKTYHRKCMATPVKNKPRKGYIFECSTCVENSREKQDELQSQNALDDRKSTKSDHSDRLTKKHNDINHKEKSNTHPYLNANKQPITKGIAILLNYLIGLIYTKQWFLQIRSRCLIIHQSASSIHGRMDI
jgi:hypothetical protein